MTSDNNTKEKQPMTIHHRLKPRSLLARITLYFALFLVLFIFAIWLAIPPVANWYLTDFYKQQNRLFSADDISVNFFPPSVHLEKVRVSHEESTELELNRLDIQVSVAPLFKKTAYISDARIDGLFVYASQSQNAWNIAGLNIPLNSSNESNNTQDSGSEISKEEHTQPQKPSEQQAQENPSDGSMAWRLVVPKFEFNNSQFKIHNLLNDNITDSIAIKYLQVEDLQNQGLDVSGNVALDLNFNESNLALKSNIQYLQFLADIKLNSLDINAEIKDFLHFLPKEYRPLSGNINTSLQGNIKQVGATEFEVSLPSVDMNLNKLSADVPNAVAQLDTVNVRLTNSNISNTSNGELSATGILSTSLEKLDATFEDNKVQTQSFNLEVNQFALNKEGNAISLTVPSIELKNNNLQYENAKTKVSNNSVHLQLGNLVATIAEDKTLKLSTSLSSELNQSSLALDQLHLNNDRMAFDIEQLEVVQSDDKLNAKTAQTKVSNTHFILTESENVLASVGQVDLDLPTLRYSGTAYAATLAHLRLADIELSNLKDAPPLTVLDSLTIQDVNAVETHAEIKSIDLKGLRAHLLLDENRQLINLATLPAANDASDQNSTAHESTTNSSSANNRTNANNSEKLDNSTEPNKNTDLNNDETNSNKFALRLHEFSLSDNSYIQILDKSVEPDLDSTIDIDQLTATHIDSKDPNSVTHVLLKARNGKYSTIDLNADIQPFANKLTMQSKLAIRETELPPYSPYIAQALGYRIDSGQMDMDLDLNADKGQLEGNTHLVFREFDLGGRQESSKVVQTGAMPLNIAVGVLKDGQGNIELDIPLEGDVDNPEFKWTGFLMLPIKQALYKASASYLMQTFVPYANVISIAQIAGEQILKIRVEPLEFSFQQGQILPEQHSYLDQLNALMTDKPDSQVKACGIAVLGDLGESDELTIAEPEQQNTYLNGLANERANALKDYLVGKGIASNRIFVCAPQIDRDDDAKPRVALKF
ncbi:DUF748 domain-containing protein [Marinomonas mediterranea]|jgi:Domain of Unknown Function (DUF748).|uniref:Uncharacterized protein n=1 Tax=Marinomonas mediterranea (strain ATCC 700492 / JCM 21426 / NBRC 103028 / MMB-1) TaxID=717774 RepID=F2JX99_MARM1|nr:DUF748 domain-containing protein [Marinomonas mediterranea]ADZ90705.1 protein of unknown function DUF748 [Marinomonas mediterranea MMB-1]WCN16868.1 DUF748 domain-containing protein [Marinomonas mediterranea MMB-1]